MYIIEIILEGFKSYAQRTVIKDFDTQFNAITGLNGSGKSNIMDSILFVLGITKDLDLLRVQNLKELIYKSGHAGISKAEATIRFDNRDKNMSPMGYESCETIVVTRQVTQDKSKYFVNGIKEQQNKVKNMFRGVQLNIDNPHFYVGQGRITKIISLKSSELISMLEETAGTALYNEKKKESTKIIEKKEEKLAEIKDLIEKDIKPQIQKLRAEREQYLLWKSQEIELIRLTKLLKSYEYFKKEKNRDKEQSNLANMKQISEGISQEKQAKQNEQQQLQQELEDCKKNFNSEQNKQYKELEQRLNEQKKEVAKSMTTIENRRKRIQGLEKELQVIQKQLAENETGEHRAGNKSQYLIDQLQTLENTLKEKKEQFDEAQSNIESTKQGNINKDDAKQQIQKQLNDVKAHLTHSKNTIKSTNDQIQHLERDIQMKQDNLVNVNQDGNAKEKQIQILEKEASDLEHELNESNFNEMAMNEQRNDLRRSEEQVMHLSHQIEQFSGGQNWIFRLNFNNPESNFDRSRVRGRVFSLFEQKEDRFLKALESGAGGKLLNIVVDNEVTSKLLLKRNCFSFGVNMIPNNKISTFQPNQQITRFAEEVSRKYGGFAIPAHECINYDNINRNAMLFVFGGFFICSSQEIAKEISQNRNRQMRYRCVNLEGDVYDTQGTLSGGYMNTGNMILSRYQELKKLQIQLQDGRNQQNRLQEEYNKLKEDGEYYQGLMSDLDNKKKKIDYLQKQVSQFDGAKIENKINENKLKIEDLHEQLKRTKVLCDQQEIEISDLTKELTNFSQTSNIKDIYTNKVKKLKGDIAACKQQINQIKSDISKQEVEQESCQKNFKKLEKQQETESKNLEMERAQLEVDRGTQKSHQDSLNKQQKQKEQLEKEIHKFNKVSTKLQESLTVIATEIRKLDDDLKKNDNKVNKYMQESKHINEQLAKLEENFKWIPENKHLFGQPGSEFDYTDFNYNQQSQKFQDLKLDQDKLSKKVNFKVEAASDNVEKRFQNLKEKREKLEEDKSNLETNMVDLDKKRQITLEKCFLDVNKNFGEIFQDLLPNAFAKLTPIEGKRDIGEGLELQVKLGKAWRSSLSELSGGQRSLLALSFVLSLLLYKPAPFYILDEVDAALDLSHTENIGNMIAQRFPQSQFLIISHKDGMYQNANVLFKTSIVDGNSRIDRYQFQSKKKKRIALEEGK